MPSLRRKSLRSTRLCRTSSEWSMSCAAGLERCDSIHLNLKHLTDSYNSTRFLPDSFSSRSIRRTYQGTSWFSPVNFLSTRLNSWLSVDVVITY